MNKQTKQKHINNLNTKIKKRKRKRERIYTVQNQRWTFVFLLWVGGCSGLDQTDGHIDITVTGIKHTVFQTALF